MQNQESKAPSGEAGLQKGQPGGAGWRSKVLEAGAVVVRWGLGVYFVNMGLTKALHPDLFLKLVRQYQVTSNPYLLNAIAAGLPWFEVFCGLLLVAGVAVRGASLVLLALLACFTPLILARALGLAAAHGLPLCLVKFDCGCGAGEVFACHKLVENCLLMLLCAWLLTGRGRRLAAWFSPVGGRAAAP